MSLITRYVATAAGIVMVGLIAWGWIQTARIGSLQNKLRVAETERDAALSANASNLTTIDAQKDALARWEAGATAQADKVAIAATQEQSARSALQTLRAQINALGERDAQNVDCQQIRAIDFAAACPADAAALRLLATDDRPD